MKDLSRRHLDKPVYSAKKSRTPGCGFADFSMSRSDKVALPFYPIRDLCRENGCKGQLLSSPVIVTLDRVDWLADSRIDNVE